MKRKKFWILPDFQARLIRQWTILVFVTTLATQVITLGYIWYQDQHLTGQYYYVNEQAEDSSLIVDPVSVSAHRIMLPSVLTALVMGVLASILVGIFYSHRLAGPIYRIRRTLREHEEGRKVEPIVLRRNDEFKELADDINRLLVSRR